MAAIQFQFTQARVTSVRAKKIVLVANKVGGRGLRALASSLSNKLGYHVYRVTPDRVRRRTPVVFNTGIDKITQLTKFREANVSSPDFVCTADAIPNLPTKRVVARRLINASEGRGITVFEKGTTPPPAPLYVSYIVKKKEYRVHVWNNQVIDVAEKRKRRGFELERDAFVRNCANGYVFCRDRVVEPTELRALAVSAVRSIDRTNGAVDVIWNEKMNKCFVLEVNSRPGMEGTTVAVYANAILREKNAIVREKNNAR